MKDKNNVTRIGLPEAIPISLIEVSEKCIRFETSKEATEFLGIAVGMLDGYVKHKTKIIKSKYDGKTYLIKRIPIKDR